MGLAAGLGVLGATFGLSLSLQTANRVATKSHQELPRSVVIALGDTLNRGHGLFDRNCAHCHGEDARGDEGPSLHSLAKSNARISSIIKGGIKGEMPGFSKKFTEADIEALVSFLRTLRD